MTICLFVCGSAAALAQGWEYAITHVTAASNITGHITTIDHPALNGRSNLKLFITEDATSGTPMNHPLGVWYNGSKWTIFCEDFASMPVGHKFNVLACEPSSNAFNQLCTTNNLSFNRTILDHPLLNGQPGAHLMVTRDWTVGHTYHIRNIGVWYDSAISRWTVYNQDRSNMVAGVNFNVYVEPDGTRVLTHSTTSGNLSGSYTLLNNPALNGHPEAKLFVVQDWGTGFTYVDAPLMVRYASGTWRIARKDYTPLTAGLHFNVLVARENSPIPVQPGYSIQAAIDAASSGEVVEVAPGTYTEDISLRTGVDVKGAGSNATTLTGTGTGPVVTANGVTDAELSGFHIQGSSSLPLAGIQINGGSLVVSHNEISGTVDGIATSGSSAVICGNRITGTGDAGNGHVDYGIRCGGDDLVMNNLIVQNLESGVLAVGSSYAPRFVNNTIANNGGTAFQAAWGHPTLKNNILSDNGALGIFSENNAIVESTYNCVHGHSTDYAEVRGGTIVDRTGDITTSPTFDTASPGGYFLSAISPCIDAGDPASAYNDPDGTRNDMGAFGGPCSPLTPGSGVGDTGFMFTSIGNIPTSEIGSDGLAHNATYRDAPFGKTLHLFGDFGRAEDEITHYTVLIGGWSGGTAPTFPADFVPVADPLVKTFWDGSGPSSFHNVVVGPHYVGGVPYYARTDSHYTGGFWAFENLITKLNTTHDLPDGKYDLVLQAYRTTATPLPGGPPTGPTLAWTTTNQPLTIVINNKRPTVEIVSVSKDSSSAADECSLLRMTPDHYVDDDGDPSTPPKARSTENLRFVITVNHPDGYLLNYSLIAEVGRDRTAGTITSDSYDPAGGVFWSGVTATPFDSSAAMGTGIPPVGGTLQAWETCAYQFTLRAWARTTDGYHRIYWADPFHENLALDLGGLCGPNPDLDGDGDVDGDDLQIFADAYGLAISE